MKKDFKKTHIVNLICHGCGYENSEDKKSFFDAKVDRDYILNNNPFIYKCPDCGKKIISYRRIRYIDRKRKFVVYYDNLVDLMLDENKFRNDPETQGYTVCGALTYEDFVTNIVALENGLDWRVIKAYIRRVEVALERVRSKEDKKIFFRDTLLTYQNDKLIIKTRFVSDKESESSSPFKMELYQKAYDKYFSWLDEMNLVCCSIDTICDLLDKKKTTFLYPTMVWCFVDWLGIKRVCVVDELLVKKLRIGDTVICTDIRNKFRFEAEVIGFRKYNYYHMPIHIYDMSQINSVAKDLIESTSLPESLPLDNKQLVDLLNEYRDKVYGNINFYKIILELSKSQLIILNTVDNNVHIGGAIFDKKEHVMVSAGYLKINNKKYLRVYTDQSLVNKEGQLFVVSFDVIAKIMEQNPSIYGVVFNPDTDEIYMPYSLLKNYSTRKIVCDISQLEKVVSGFSSEEKELFLENEWKCLYAHAIEHKGLKTIAKELKLSINKASYELKNALSTVENILKDRQRGTKLRVRE